MMLATNAMNSLDADIDGILHQLAVCMTWCGDRSQPLDSDADLADAFRSEALAPFAAAVFPESCHTPFSLELLQQFQRFAAERERLTRNVTLNAVGEFNRDRALLIVNWHSSLFDGAVVPETRGFINEDYIPGWDTWLAIVGIRTDYSAHALLCWIPESLADRVDSAIRIDPASCLAWCHTVGRMIQHRAWGKGFTEC
jgi:hypothetical protein